jgi:hypothetical protein
MSQKLGRRPSVGVVTTADRPAVSDSIRGKLSKSPSEQRCVGLQSCSPTGGLFSWEHLLRHGRGST